jgi:hypothetical protein
MVPGRDRRRLAGGAATLAAACSVALLGAGTAGAQYPEQPQVERPNPCVGAAAANLLCPDLQMAPPSRLFVSGKRGRLRLHARNDIRSRGEGPIEIRGTRTAKRTMSVRQAIHNRAGKRKLFETDGLIVFYDIPGQGPYWKFEEAARFELWSLDAGGGRTELVRVGPKLTYCFRDLEHTKPSKRSPRKAVYPACSQNPRARSRTLGTSVGWSDVYPADYHENWISIKGLSGCFDFVHRADPDNYLFENNEANNQNSRRVQLPPPKRGKVRSC